MSKQTTQSKLARARKLARERQRRRRARMAEGGFKAIQGLTVPIEHHDECKEACIKACAEIVNGRQDENSND